MMNDLCKRGQHEHSIFMMDRDKPYVFENEEVVLGESRPLSELLFVVSIVSAAAIDISRSSSGGKHKNTQSDRGKK